VRCARFIPEPWPHDTPGARLLIENLRDT